MPSRSVCRSAQELEPLRVAFEELAPLPSEEWRFLCENVELRDYERGERLVAEGERVDWLGFLLRGLVRIHCEGDEREVTLGFDCEGRFVGAYDAYALREPARYGIESLESSRVARFGRSLLEVLEVRHLAWRELFRRIAERELVRKVDKELRIRTCTPAERYAELVRSGSYLVRRVPQYHLASFLGIAPETLSRIRARSSSPTPRSTGS
jgi:CRP-like cAMP-binding protein